MHQIGTRGGCRVCHHARPVGLNGIKGLWAALGQNADQVDRGVRPAHRGLDRGGVAQIGLYRMDLTHHAERLQMPRQFGPPHRDSYAVLALGQRANHASPQKTRSSENGDQRVHIRCHAVNSWGQKFSRSWEYLTISRYANMPVLYSAFAVVSVNLTSAQAIRTNPPGPRWRNW